MADKFAILCKKTNFTMKNKSLRSFFLANVWLFLAQTAWSLDLGVSHWVYYTPDGKPYLEVNFEIASVSIFYQKTVN
jgi:hypothetical protein